MATDIKVGDHVVIKDDVAKNRGLAVGTRGIVYEVDDREGYYTEFGIEFDDDDYEGAIDPYRNWFNREEFEKAMD